MNENKKLYLETNNTMLYRIRYNIYTYNWEIYADTDTGEKLVATCFVDNLRFIDDPDVGEDVFDDATKDSD